MRSEIVRPGSWQCVAPDRVQRVQSCERKGTSLRVDGPATPPDARRRTPRDDAPRRRRRATGAPHDLAPRRPCGEPDTSPDRACGRERGVKRRAEQVFFSLPPSLLPLLLSTDLVQPRTVHGTVLITSPRGSINLDDHLRGASEQLDLLGRPRAIEGRLRAEPKAHALGGHAQVVCLIRVGARTRARGSG